MEILTGVEWFIVKWHNRKIFPGNVSPGKFPFHKIKYGKERSWFNDRIRKKIEVAYTLDGGNFYTQETH